MKKCGLESLAINSDTTTMAKQSKGLDLFQDARREVTMILLSPEQLKSKSCERLLNDKEFGKRLCMVGVDEAHLINSWGSNFRKDFRQIGWTRLRLLNRVPTLAVTATLQVGDDNTSMLHSGFLAPCSRDHPAVQPACRYQAIVLYLSIWLGRVVLP